MAVDAFLKIAGVDGESKDAKHAAEIEVLSWSWGMSQSGTLHTGGGGGAGKVNVQDLSITKYVDKSTPTIISACCTGKHFDDATLVQRKAGGDEPLEYMKIEMIDLLVTSHSTGGSAGEDRLTEMVSLNFAKVKVSYQEQDDKGAKKGGAIDVGFDIAGNAKL